MYLYLTYTFKNKINSINVKTQTYLFHVQFQKGFKFSHCGNIFDLGGIAFGSIIVQVRPSDTNRILKSLPAPYLHQSFMGNSFRNKM